MGSTQPAVSRAACGFAFNNTQGQRLPPPRPAALPSPRTRQLVGGEQLREGVVLKHAVQGDNQVLGHAQRHVTGRQRLGCHSNVDVLPLASHRLQLDLLLRRAALLRGRGERGQGGFGAAAGGGV